MNYSVVKVWNGNIELSSLEVFWKNPPYAFHGAFLMYKFPGIRSKRKALYCVLENKNLGSVSDTSHPLA
jgi:hypothetical protein